MKIKLDGKFRSLKRIIKLGGIGNLANSLSTIIAKRNCPRAINFPITIRRSNRFAFSVNDLVSFDQSISVKYNMFVG